MLSNSTKYLCWGQRFSK